MEFPAYQLLMQAIEADRDLHKPLGMTLAQQLVITVTALAQCKIPLATIEHAVEEAYRAAAPHAP